MRLADRACWGALALAVSLALAASNLASAAEIHIGGIDVETQYTQPDSGPPAVPGILTFDDADNGMNDAQPGRVTSSDLEALVGADVDFEVALSPLDVNGDPFDPATGDVRWAQFIGTGPMPEILIRDNTTVLLAFQVHLLDVQQAAHSDGPLGKPDGKIALGNPEIENFGIASNLTVAGGTLNALVGGRNTPAVMELLMSSLDPKMTRVLRDQNAPGYLNLDFTSGHGTDGESTTWNITIVPEPSTAVLLGFALLGLLAAARRRAPR